MLLLLVRVLQHPSELHTSQCHGGLRFKIKHISLEKDFYFDWCVLRALLLKQKKSNFCALQSINSCSVVSCPRSQTTATNQMSDGFCDFTLPLGTSQELGLAINPVKLCPIVKFRGEMTLKILELVC